MIKLKKKSIKKINIKLKSTRLTCQTSDMTHETEIIIKKKQTIINYEIQSLISQVLRDEIR
jgi:hypothetical protein